MPMSEQEESRQWLKGTKVMSFMTPLECQSFVNFLSGRLRRIVEVYKTAKPWEYLPDEFLHWHRIQQESEVVSFQFSVLFPLFMKVRQLLRQWLGFALGGASFWMCLLICTSCWFKTKGTRPKDISRANMIRIHARRKATTSGTTPPTIIFGNSTQDCMIY